MLERLGQVFRGNEPVAIAIELAVIWAAVFLMLRFLRGTRGAGVLKGVIVILATLILGLRFAETGSDTFARLRFVGEALVGTLALALVVIFQPELRQALIRLGQTGWFRGTDPRFAEMVPAVDEAVEFLSRNQFGALIVIERGVPLSDMTATGVAIDSVVSARLLESVFWPNSPLHDLAVVISGNRIVAANVQLPIADASSVPARLGSRHQAAVGATMETDAVVVVVSEQTGAIRIARHGAISEPIAYDDFAPALRTALTAVEDAEHAPSRTESA
ncbi:MAG: diadenylate cyclase [Proteobacteria bacterium]|nr:diadenylate cyclase [Pseudomonadota bacterium]